MIAVQDRTYERWKSDGEIIMCDYDREQWRLADWIREGMARFETCYQDMGDITNRSYQTLMNKASVAERWPAAARTYELSWSHYCATAYLPDTWRRHLMTRAESLRLSCARVRERARRIQAWRARHGETVRNAWKSMANGALSRYTGVGKVSLEGDYGLRIDIDASTGNVPPGVLAGMRVRVTIEVMEESDEFGIRGARDQSAHFVM